MDPIIDLQELMIRIDKTKKHKMLVRGLKRLLLVQGCSADLQQAGYCIDRLTKVLPEGGEPIVEQALLMSAIIFYARATVGGASKGGRGSIDIRSALDGGQKVDHDTIKDFRNEAVAHVHVGTTADAWHQQFLALIPTDEGWRVMCTSRGFTRNRSVQDALIRLVPKAQSIMIDRFHESVRNAASLFNEAAASLDVEPYLVDAAHYFGDEEIAKQILASKKAGRSATIFF